MLLEVTPKFDIPLDYKFGKTDLKKNKQYVLQHAWAQDLPCEKHPIEVNPYNLNINPEDGGVLFIRAMGMGDMLFLSPLISILKQKHPTCKIGFAAVKAQHHMLELIPNIDEIHEYPIESSVFHNYKHHFTVEGLVEGNKENQNKNIYEVFLEHIGFPGENDTLSPEWCRPILKDVIMKVPVEKKDKLIGIHPFAVDPMRQLNLYATSVLVRMLQDRGFDIVLFSNELEKQHYSGIFPTDVKWAIDSVYNIHSTARLLASCKCVISCDSLITHLAQAVDVKTFCIYGPFSSNSRVGHYKNITIIDNNPDCRCNAHQVGQCPKGFRISPCLTFDPENLIELILTGENLLNIETDDPIVNKFNWENNDVEVTEEEIQQIEKVIEKS